MTFEIERLTKFDYDYLVTHLEDYWGDRGKELKPVHHPIFFYELGDTAYAIHHGDLPAAYLLGFFAQTAPTAYVHLIGVHQEYRRKGLASRLYDHFIAEAKKRGCTQLKAITQPTNRISIAFHQFQGMKLLGDPNEDGIPVVRNYRGPNEHRVVFEKSL